VSLLATSTTDTPLLNFSFRREYFTKGHFSGYFLFSQQFPKE